MAEKLRGLPFANHLDDEGEFRYTIKLKLINDMHEAMFDTIAVVHIIVV